MCVLFHFQFCLVFIKVYFFYSAKNMDFKTLFVSFKIKIYNSHAQF